MKKVATHCRKGHEFTDANTHIDKQTGARKCRTCQNERTRNKRKGIFVIKHSFEERFWAKVEKTDSCWIWTAASTTTGYGMLTDRSKKDGLSVSFRSHRVSYEMHFGKIPDGKFVCHTCDNRKCVNPSHLFLGDDQDNVSDMIAKKRHWQQRKTHCKNGHEFIGDNYYIDPRDNNTRVCNICRKLSGIRAYEKVKARKSKT